MSQKSVCTFENGYYDQPIYSCITCAEIAGRPVGVCYGCYLECHLGHDNVVELFTRRKFRCDCPTLSDTICDCSLYKPSEPAPASNPKNKYTSNFEGIFCWCRRGYSADSNATMIECFLCEDWFHSTCIQEDKTFKYPLVESDDVFVCKDCLGTAPILKEYACLQTPLEAPPAPQSAVESSTTSSTSVAPSEAALAPPAATSSQSDGSTQNVTSEPKRECSRPESPTLITTHALFIPDWTKQLCRCTACREVYEKQNVGWLLDVGAPTAETDEPVDITTTDTSGMTLAQAVENAKKRKRDPAPLNLDVYSAGLEAFRSLPNREAKGDVLHAYDSFASKLEVFFKEAAEQGKVISEKDIRDFFNSLKGARKYLR